MLHVSSSTAFFSFCHHHDDFFSLYALQHDFMGQIVLPLGRLASGEPVSFDEPVILSSVAKGRLAGTLQLQWPSAAPAIVTSAAAAPSKQAAESGTAAPPLASPVGGDSGADGKEWGARPATPKANTGCTSCTLQ